MFLFGEPDPQVLYAVYDLFVKAGDESIYDRMIARLQSTNLGYRTASVRYLPKIRGTRALPELHSLLKDGAASIRIEAANSLGELRQVESVPYLSDALRNENDVEVRKALISALGNVADVSIVQSISYLIFDPALADIAVEALAKVNHPTVIQTLRNCLQNRFSTPTRIMALKAIIRISTAEGFPIFRNTVGWLPEGFLTEAAQLYKGNFVEYLREAMKSMKEETRREAVLAFRFAGPEVEGKILDTELFQSKDVTLRAMILERITESRGAAALPILEAFFSDPAKELRVASMALAGRVALPGGTAEQKLKTLLMDADETNRIHAAVALTRMYIANPPAPVK
jgi:HEAT repeat protein